MNTPDGPILDNHLHLDPVNGLGVAAAQDFADHGGTHLLVLNKPSWALIEAATDEATFRECFDLTVGVTREADERLAGRAWPVLGVHPALISQLTDEGYTPAEVGEIMQTGIDIAAEYVANGTALAIKSGRPHYEVDDEVWRVSNEVMEHAFARAADVGCAVQLHTEGGEEFGELVERAAEAGLPADQVVKHYSNGAVTGPIKSVIANTDDLETAVERDEPFLMETDFIDDPERPGAVLGPKTVPKRVRWMHEQGWDDAIKSAHVDTPARVYGIDTEATLNK
jgi:TatD-related deoxyribonuclease